MLLNLSGAHGPFFTRNVAIVTDSAGNVGARRGARRRGDPAHHRGRRRAAGRRSRSRAYASAAARGRRPRSPTATRPAAGGRPSTSASPSTPSPPWSPRCSTCSASTSASPWPSCSATGSSATAVPVLGYLFYVGDRTRDRPALRRRAGPGRRLGTAAPRAGPHPGRGRGARRGRAGPVRLHRLQAQGRRAAPASRRSPRSGPWPRGSREARITLDPNGGWLLRRRGRAVPRPARRARLRRGPVGAEGGCSGRETMAEFRRATGLPPRPT